MKRKIITLVLACITLTLPACDLPGGGKTPENISSEEDAEEDAEEDNSGKKTDKSDWATINDEDIKDNKTKKENEDITWTYRSHPIELRDRDDLLANGYYVTVELSEESAASYPALSSAIDDFDRAAEEDMTSYLFSSEEEIRELKNEGMTVNYEEDRFLYPLRSDSRVFSFIVENYSYMGGAHGTTSYTGFNFDPEKGQKIAFSDVVKETEGLPQIIIDELIKQNSDLEEYFANLPTDKENLLEDVTGRIADGAKNLTWGLSYKGMEFYFEDYAMGSYAAGARTVTVAFSDYPEFFSDEYVYGKKGRKPDIDRLATKLDDADTVMLSTAGQSGAADASPSDQGKPISLSPGELQKLNLFLSNFAEQRMTYYDDGSDVAQVSNFAYIWSVINKPSNIRIEGDHYKISFDTVKKLADKYLGRKITDDEMYGYAWKDAYGGFAKNGWYYVPAADGESYASFAIADDVRELEDGVYGVTFSVYELDIDEYWDNNSTIPKKFYSLTPSQASSASDLRMYLEGTATVRRSGDSYTLVNYSVR